MLSKLKAITCADLQLYLKVITCCSNSTSDLEILVTKTCSMTGSVSSADSPKSELSVGTGCHPRTTCPSDSATCKDKIINQRNELNMQILHYSYATKFINSVTPTLLYKLSFALLTTLFTGWHKKRSNNILAW